jgi:threonine dehydratase
VLNTEICGLLVDSVVTLSDEEIFAAQRELVRRGDWTVEPAGAAAAALVLAKKLPAPYVSSRTSENPLRVAVVVSGGNPDPAQLATIRA